MKPSDLPLSGIHQLGSLSPYLDAFSAVAEDLDLSQRSNLIFLDKCLHEHWGLGQNVILNWCADQDGMSLLVMPHYDVAKYSTDATGTTSRDPQSAGRPSERFFTRLISGRRQLSPEQLDKVARLLHVDKIYVPLRQGLSGSPVETKIVEKMIKRYSISYVPNRAVALFDIVGFSLLTPFEQMTQLNSLSYSVNSAHSKMLNKEIDIDFARSTTGDGFYIWNREVGVEANTNLYHFMHLILADNAIARRKAEANTVPLLRACFHVGGSYEFHQAEGLNPTLYNYIVGDVTIELARMIERALPGQIFVGDFHARLPEFTEADSNLISLDAIGFVDRAQEHLTKLNGLVLSGERIESIKCYLTGQRLRSGEFSIRKLTIGDKHGLSRSVFNAKINIYRESAAPILLGIEDRVIASNRLFAATSELVPHHVA